MSEEKTEKPTPKKIRDARKKGQVAKSQDLSSTMTFITLIFSILVLSGLLMEKIKGIFNLSFGFITRPNITDMISQIFNSFEMFCTFMIPLIFLAAIVGILTTFFQIGAIFSTESVSPKLEKINPISKLKQMFSLKNFVTFLLNICKVILIGSILVFIFAYYSPSFVKLVHLDVDALISVTGMMFKIMVYSCTAAYILLSFIDFIIQKKDLMKNLKMTKDEVKREYKESEGDPQIKGKRKEIHREILENNSMARVPKATVMVTNPTHYAVALHYIRKEKKLPKVIAKGEGALALSMMKSARGHNIPIYQDVPLARKMYADIEIDDSIPTELIKSVGKVLKWVGQQENYRTSSHLDS